MKKLVNNYILFWLRPMYKRLAPKPKKWYSKFIYWRYGITDSLNSPKIDRVNQIQRYKQQKQNARDNSKNQIS